eukprot:4499481-Pyramimonas_sp.AAC.2
MQCVPVGGDINLRVTAVQAGVQSGVYYCSVGPTCDASHHILLLCHIRAVTRLRLVTSLERGWMYCTADYVNGHEPRVRGSAQRAHNHNKKVRFRQARKVYYALNARKNVHYSHH